MLLVLAVAFAMAFTVTLTVVTVLMQLLGAVGAFELVAFAGSAEKGDRGKQQRKAFHCGVL